MTAPQASAGVHPFLREGAVDDRQRLLDFVDYVRTIVETVLNSTSIRYDFRQLLFDAWADPEVARALNRIRDRIPTAEESRLVENGMTGRQLEMKWRVMARLDAEYRAASTRTKRGFVAAVRNAASRAARVFGWRVADDKDVILEKLLEVLKSAFKSLLKALGLDGPIGEILDFLHALMQDSVKKSLAL